MIRRVIMEGAVVVITVSLFIGWMALLGVTIAGDVVPSSREVRR